MGLRKRWAGAIASADWVEGLSFVMVQDSKVAILTAERIVEVVTSYPVETSEQWLLLKANMPRVAFFATDLNPHSFEWDSAECAWLGRAELLLSAPSALRPGQAMLEVSFTLPVRVLLRMANEELTIAAFDFYSAAQNATASIYVDPDDGPPKTIGWGPFEGLL